MNVPPRFADVDDGVILYRRPCADPNRTVVAAQDRAEPDARFRPDFDVADQYGGRCNKRRRIDLRPLASIFDDHERCFARRARRTSPRCIATERRCAASRQRRVRSPTTRTIRQINYEYAGRTGHVHEVVEIGGRQLAKIGFDDRKIVYYFLDDVELDQTAKRGTFHDTEKA